MSKIQKIPISVMLATMLFMFLAVIPQTGDLYTAQLMGKIITYMIFALALDLLWGEAGLMNLGFAVFFGLGSYIFGISLAIQSGLPAFMKSGGLTKIPFFYQPLENVYLAIILGVIVPAIIAGLLVYFIFSSKIKGVFFNIITLAFAGLFELFIKNQQAYTGGSSGVNGIATGLRDFTFFGITIDMVGWYYIALVSLVLVFISCYFIKASRLGRVINSIRDNEDRLQFLGYNPAVFKVVIFCIAAAVAGFAGVLYVPIASFISIESAGVSFSTMALVWLAVGGRGYLSGGLFGALLISLLQNKFSNLFGGMWQLILGVVMILIIFFLPKGIIGTIIELQKSYLSKKRHRIVKTEQN